MDGREAHRREARVPPTDWIARCSHDDRISSLFSSTETGGERRHRRWNALRPPGHHWRLGQ